MTLPGRQIRSHAMASSAVNSRCFIIHSAINVPVRPSPARQCTAMAPWLVSAMRRKRSTMESGGGVQSAKYRSWWWNPSDTIVCRSYSLCVSRTTVLTPLYLKTWQ
eukprot:3615848-Rhodomonas_salina.1